MDITGLEEYILETMETYEIPGLSACAVKNGDIIWSCSYGYANFEEERLVEDSTVFYLASISKTVVAVALMQLCEDNLFALDDNINDYLPFSVVHPIFPDSLITFRMLLSHTSSIRETQALTDTTVFWGGDSPIPLGYFLQEYLVPGGIYYNPQASFTTQIPGTYYNYSNIGAALAGYLVEQISGMAFEPYCQNNIFIPLEMSETSWFIANLDTNNFARPYAWDPVTWSFIPYDYYGVPYYPCGMLKTSAPQLARFLIAFMQMGQIGGVRILDSTTVVEMTTIHYPTIAPNQGLLWANLDLGDRSVWGHTGYWYGVATCMYYSPEENTGIVVLTTDEYLLPVLNIMSELFDYAAGFTSVTCTLIPNGTPIVIPSDGGSFDFQTTIENETDSTAVVDFWVDATLPTGGSFGPIILRENVRLSPYGLMSRQLTQYVPPGAPAGEYSYNAYLGYYPDYGWSQDSFSFSKEEDAGGNSITSISDWQISDWEGDISPIEISHSSNFIHVSTHPNPFNPTTTISYQLSAANFVTLAVYDVSGRMVAELVDGWRDAGIHEVTFDGGNLVSGVYIYRLEAGYYTASGKMVLMK